VPVAPTRGRLILWRQRVLAIADALAHRTASLVQRRELADRCADAYGDAQDLAAEIEAAARELGKTGEVPVIPAALADAEPEPTPKRHSLSTFCTKCGAELGPGGTDRPACIRPDCPIERSG
jgi:hypothetical protein